MDVIIICQRFRWASTEMLDKAIVVCLKISFLLFFQVICWFKMDAIFHQEKEFQTRVR